MSAERMMQILFLLHWRIETLAEVLGCRTYLVKAWSDGRAHVPEEVSNWLEMLGEAHLITPPQNWMHRKCPPRFAAGEKVPVFEALVWNAVAADLTLLDDNLRTIEGIHRVGADPDITSERLVDGSEIDDEGVYRMCLDLDSLR